MNSARSDQSHHQQARRKGAIEIAVITVSDTRTPETDVNGKYLQEQISLAGHRLFAYRIVPDEKQLIESVLEEFTRQRCQALLFNGGTGISRRDTTFDVLSARLDKVLTGFGELFRMLSYQQVGAAAMLSRATAGIYRDSVIISVPGSPAAVELAWQELIAPEIQHLAWELTR